MHCIRIDVLKCSELRALHRKRIGSRLAALRKTPGRRVVVLFDPQRHEPLDAVAWDEQRARDAIARIVADTEQQFSSFAWWPAHPRDREDGEHGPYHMLYCGAGGVIWALRYLELQGAAELRGSYALHVATLLAPNRVSMQHPGDSPFGSYLMGDTGIELLNHWYDPTRATAARLATLIDANIEHPARELMWGAPGTLLAALFLFKRTGDPRWADLFRATAAQLWLELEYSTEFECRYWTQHLYGRRSTFLDAVHGFVATASPLIQGRELLSADAWAAWSACIANTIRRTAEREGDHVNWRVHLIEASDRPRRPLVQFCHGAPGFVICLADFPDASLDDLLLGGGALTWDAGPLRKGANLCHGTSGNGYAFLKLYRRFGDPQWLERARAFAMHAIAQAEADFATHGHSHHSLWTGDLGVAIYLWDCVRGGDRFPTLDVFFVD
jgi:hypothetical protein